MDVSEIGINLVSPAGETSSPMLIFVAGVSCCDADINTGVLFIIWNVEVTSTLSVLADGITCGYILDVHWPACAVTTGGVTVLGRARYPVTRVDVTACPSGIWGAIGYVYGIMVLTGVCKVVFIGNGYAAHWSLAEITAVDNSVTCPDDPDGCTSAPVGILINPALSVPVLISLSRVPAAILFTTEDKGDCFCFSRKKSRLSSWVNFL